MPRGRQLTPRHPQESEALRQQVRDRAKDLFDAWSEIADKYRNDGTALQYNPAEVAAAKPLLHDFLDPELKTMHARHKKFRANRSMRDVEPSVNLWVKTLDNIDVEEDE